MRAYEWLINRAKGTGDVEFAEAVKWFVGSYHAALEASERRFLDEKAIRASERERCARLCEVVSAEYQKREGMQWPEMKTDAQEGAETCAHRIRGEDRL